MIRKTVRYRSGARVEYHADIDDRPHQQSVKFIAPSQRAQSVTVPLQLVIEVAKSLPANVLFGNDVQIGLEVVS